jgi:hypothetical protein
MELSIRFRDEGHLKAHLDHFAVPLETALGWVKEQLSSRTDRSGWAHFDFACPGTAGVSGLKTLGADDKAFWARRRGRTIPSHLLLGDKVPTDRLCVWGYWESPSAFVLHTLYPGVVAPREIDDPELHDEDRPAAVAFWTRHALLVAPGEWDE